MRAVDEQATIHAGLHNRRAVGRELDADHTASDADFLDRAAARLQRLQLGADLLANLLSACQEAIRLDGLYRGEGGSARERVAAECGRVRARLQLLGELGFGNQTATGDAAR